MPAYKTANKKKKLPQGLLGIMLDNYDNQLDLKLEKRFRNWVKANLCLIWIFGIRIGELEVVKQYHFVVDEHFIYFNSPPEKNPKHPDRSLSVSLDTPHLDILITYLEGLDSEDSVLAMSDTTFWRRLKTIDIELSVHVFRHNRGTQMALTRPSPYELMVWMGHSNINQAIEYIHASGTLAEDLGQRVTIK